MSIRSKAEATSDAIRHSAPPPRGGAAPRSVLATGIERNTSRSNAEESLATLIRWEKLPEPEREYRFAPPRRWRFDFAWRPKWIGGEWLGGLAVEVDGGSFVAGRHTRGEGFEKDLEKLNEAALLGWTVLRVTPRMIEDGRAITLIKRALQ